MKTHHPLRIVLSRIGEATPEERQASNKLQFSQRRLVMKFRNVTINTHSP
jgi:hypothetical protein